ncbi:unnamed protein product [Vitrella brassicaformis CCMP3155]|uniref:Uncharacterized protein n=1 Tax=Vitrella brassicaformis (strain CCMP3155) TaxID=1169540 RepID=A0A0G4FEF5_VITBC|nr:unnamed protein product [Vitrella brassicaformis CCMP3155]|eukprot:CEM11581.1 unnamed protein product [Vitrella brassicaformis CCMP3155]
MPGPTGRRSMLLHLQSIRRPLTHFYRRATSWYQAKFKELSRKRYRPVDVSGYEVDGTGRYAGIFVRERGAPAFVSHHGMTSAEYQQYQYQYDSDGYRLPSGRREGAVDTYQAFYDEYVGQGYKLVQVSGFGVGDTAYYAAIWER